MFFLKNNRINKDFKIDLVYLWVDGSDSEFIKQRNYYQEKCGILSSEANCEHNYVDHEELRYSLRSVFKNAPWINNIYIVTNGQIPKWIDFSKTDKIKIVTHDQIMPSDALPTFHSDAIEACVCNIPELEEHFILANDDTYINRPVTPDFFFDKNGNPIIRLKKYKYKKSKLRRSVYARKITYTNRLINKFYNKNYVVTAHHNMDAYRKSMVLECKNKFNEEFNKIIYSKFRITGVQRLIFSLYSHINYKAPIKYIQLVHTYFHIDTVNMRINKFENMIKAINAYTPFLICLNDHMDVQEKYLENITSFLQYLYPDKQIYEKDDNACNINPDITDECIIINKKYNSLWRIGKILEYIVSPIYSVKIKRNHKVKKILSLIKISKKLVENDSLDEV